MFFKFPFELIEFMDKLQKEKGLSDTFTFDGPPPKVLPNGSAQFSISGKP